MSRMPMGMHQSFYRLSLSALLAASLAGCAASGRFSSLGSSVNPPPSPASQRGGLVYNTPVDEPDYAPAPNTPPVVSSALPPLSGGLQGNAGGVDPNSRLQQQTLQQQTLQQQALQQQSLQQPALGQTAPQVVTAAPSTETQQLATRSPGGFSGAGVQSLGASAAPSAPAPTSRSGVIGGWTARDGAGSSCRVQLSSAPALDLYKASASGCANKDLSAITAWDYRDGEVYLYQRGGSVAARLRQSAGGFDGVLTKSGATVGLAR